MVGIGKTYMYSSMVGTWEAQECNFPLQKIYTAKILVPQTSCFVSNCVIMRTHNGWNRHLSFSNHTSNLSRSCFMHIRDLCHIRHMLDFNTLSTIAIQHSLAWAVTPRHHHITPILLKWLHWLKVPERFHFKVLVLISNDSRPCSMV